MFLPVFFIKPGCGRMFVYHFYLQGYWYCLRFLFGLSLICSSEYSHYIIISRLIVNLSVRYVTFYDRIERQWHVFVLKYKRFIGEKTSINTFPEKCQDHVKALRLSKTMYLVRLRVGEHCLYSCQDILFRSVDYFHISFRGVNELSILFDGVNELSIIFDAVNKLNILFHGVNDLHITFPGVNELNILFLASMSKIFYFQASMS